MSFADYNASIVYINKCARERKKMERKMKRPKGRHR